MFEFEPDEYIFTKFAHYFKRRRKKKEASVPYAVSLAEIKPRLTIFARAITGRPIELYEAEREGGYKDNNFFLPSKYAQFSTVEENLSFYLFRILYLSIQKNLGFNWEDTEEHSLKDSQEKANRTSVTVLEYLFHEFPVTKKYHQKFIACYSEKGKSNAAPDFSFIYGKWMKNSSEEQMGDKLKNFSDRVKIADQEQPKTTL